MVAPALATAANTNPMPGNVVTIKEDEPDAHQIIKTCVIPKHVLVTQLYAVKQIAP